MTRAQLDLLKSMASSRVAELQMGLQSIDQAMKTGISQEEQAFLLMQKGQLQSAHDDLILQLNAVEAETPSILKPT